ncbi:cell wall protein RBR3-like [Humulus lupulus]|uniref:cell wall protein RBR3-like n=1 Tax=Humulus lupulus TaxID=3486 RepID=UPI002B401599|nr:cell wall protein RBR3-like [Humulus lupulus]
MLTSSTSDLTHNSLKIITHPNEYKLFSKQRLMKRDLSISTTSMEDHHYHGGSSASIPFMWESQPGTPKVKLRENPLPPLTPPPSYCYSPISTPSSKKSSSSKTRKKTSKPNLIRTIFPKHDFNGSSTNNNTTRTRNNTFPSSPNSLSSPSSSSSLSSSPKSVSYYSSSVPSSPACTTSSKHHHGRWRMMSSSSPRRPVDSRVNNCHDEENYEEYGHDYSSPVSTLCFNGRSGASVKSRSSFYSSFIKVLLNHK